MEANEVRKGAQLVVRITTTGIAKIIHREGCRFVEGAGGLFAPYISREMAEESWELGVKACSRCHPIPRAILQEKKGSIR